MTFAAFAHVVPLFGSFLALLALGYGLRRTGRLPATAADTLTRVVTDVTMPALVLVSLGGRALATNLVWAVAASWIALGAGFGVASFARGPSPERGMVALTSSFSNTGFLGIPLVLALYGEESPAGPSAVVIDAFTTTLLLYTLGIAYARRRGTNDGSSTSLVRGLVTPASVAVVVALLSSAFGVALPSWSVRPLTTLGGATTPLVFLALGLRLELGGLAARRRSLAFVAAVKLVVVPGVALACVRAFGLRGPVAETTVLECAMPSAMMSAVLGARYGCDAELGTLAVAATTLLSLVTLPLALVAARALVP